MQGWEKPNLFWPMHWILGFNAKNHTSANKTMVLFQHSALGTQHCQWRTLGPLPYNLNLCAIKPNKTGFCWTSYDWFKKINYEKPNCKKLRGANLEVILC